MLAVIILCIKFLARVDMYKFQLIASLVQSRQPKLEY